jgi:hypothetical protein
MAVVSMVAVDTAKTRKLEGNGSDQGRFSLASSLRWGLRRIPINWSGKALVPRHWAKPIAIFAL